MRKQARVRREGLLISTDPDVPLIRVMLHASDGGVYCYLYDRMDDWSCWNDMFFDSWADAEEYCADEYGIGTNDWEVLPDPLDGCQHDWVQPLRLRNGQAEVLRDDAWVPWEPTAAEEPSPK